jgi:hypothetical protein
MEIQHGKGPWAPPVSGIVPLGSTLTLVVAINDYRGKNITYTKINIYNNIKKNSYKLCMIQKINQVFKKD